jgi:exodeoxyribonuclease VII small subunit
MIKSSDSSNSSSDKFTLQEGFNYESTVARVEAIISKIEAGKLDLAEVFDEFAAAVEYLRQCETFLHERQQQMDLLIETLADEPESF